MLLGTPTTESSELYAVTLTQGDPSWAGPLAGLALNLPVYHILEPEIRAQVPDETYEQEVSFALFSLDAEALEESVRRVREGAGADGA